MGKEYIKFQCHCKTEEDFARMCKEIRENCVGFNFEVGARLWFVNANGRIVMVEHQIATQEALEITDGEESDWFVAYEVQTLEDTSCSKELCSDLVDRDIKLCQLKDLMFAFARQIALPATFL